MKTYVSNETILQSKISPIEWQNQNIFDSNKIGGSLLTSLETLDYWEIVLTSTKRCPHQTVYTENLEYNNSGPCPTESTRNGNRHRVLSSSWWQWSGSCWSSWEFKRKSMKERHAKVHDRTEQPVVIRSLDETLRRTAFTNLLYCSLFLADRSFTADGGLP